MPRYTVSVRRTEKIDFEIDAANEAEARESYLYGDEVFAETVELEIETVEETSA